MPVALEDGYFRLLFAAWRGTKKHVDVLPYSFRPKAITVDMLKTLWMQIANLSAHHHDAAFDSAEISG